MMVVSVKRQAVRRGLAELRGLGTAIDTLDQRGADALGIARSDLRCLEILNQRGPMKAGDLAAAIGLSPTALSTALRRLEAKAYVRRSHPAGDRRQVLVNITAKAQSTAQAVFGKFAQASTRLLESYTLGDIERITHFLRDLREAFAAVASEEKRKRRR